MLIADCFPEITEDSTKYSIPFQSLGITTNLDMSKVYFAIIYKILGNQLHELLVSANNSLTLLSNSVPLLSKQKLKLENEWIVDIVNPYLTDLNLKINIIFKTIDNNLILIPLLSPDINGVINWNLTHVLIYKDSNFLNNWDNINLKVFINYLLNIGLYYRNQNSWIMRYSLDSIENYDDTGNLSISSYYRFYITFSLIAQETLITSLHAEEIV